MRTSLTDTRRVLVHGPEAPPSIPEFKRYGGRTKQIVPQTIELIWERRLGDEDYTLTTLVVHGPALKKDGQPGLTSSKSEFVNYGRVEQERPEWLSRYVGQYRP